MPSNIDYSNVTHAGTHTFEVAPVVPNASFGDNQIGTTNPILATKLKHQYTPVISQVHGTAAAAERRVRHVARAAGEVTAIEAGVVVAAVGDSVVTVDLKKNGTSVLTSPISIDSGDAAFAKVVGSISSASYVAGDVFELVVAVTAGTGTLPQGLFCDTVFREGAG